MSFFDLDNWAVYTYELPLYKPIAARGADRLIRKGFLIFLRNQWGVGIGEAAPIEGFHPVSYQQTKDDILKSLRTSTKPEYPITQCAIEMAQKQCAPKGRVPVNGLLTNSSAIDPQFSCYKIKVGRQSVSEDATMVRTIINTLPKHATVRLDANCAWSLSECMNFWDLIKGCAQRIEYIEEPLSDPSSYPQLPIPFALDERLSMFHDTLEGLSSLRAIILKPSLLGLQSCSAWIKKSTELGRYAVISSTFESSIGLFAYANIAQPNIHCGLGTSSWFKEDLLETRAVPQNGMLHMPPSNRFVAHPSLHCIASG